MPKHQGEFDLLYDAGGKIVGFPTILYHNNDKGIMILSLPQNDAIVGVFRGQPKALKYKGNSYKQLYALYDVSSRDLFDFHADNASSHENLLRIISQKPILSDEEPISIFLVLERTKEYV